MFSSDDGNRTSFRNVVSLFHVCSWFVCYCVFVCVFPSCFVLVFWPLCLLWFVSSCVTNCYLCFFWLLVFRCARACLSLYAILVFPRFLCVVICVVAVSLVATYVLLAPRVYVCVCAQVDCSVVCNWSLCDLFVDVCILIYLGFNILSIIFNFFFQFCLFLRHRTMDKVQKHNSFCTNTPSSESYKNYLYCGWSFLIFPEVSSQQFFWTDKLKRSLRYCPNSIFCILALTVWYRLTDQEVQK
jgi:hypothetical protein